jgi:hypothetical protein
MSISTWQPSASLPGAGGSASNAAVPAATASVSSAGSLGADIYTPSPAIAAAQAAVPAIASAAAFPTDQQTQLAQMQQALVSLQSQLQTLTSGLAAGVTPAVVAPAPSAMAVSTSAASTPVSGLTSDEAAVCQQQGISATLTNYLAFMSEAETIQNENDLGPGSTDTPSITQLQQMLSSWGYACTATGQFDQTTINAVLKFKQDNDLYSSYKMTDGASGLNPFINASTKVTMINKLQTQSATTTANTLVLADAASNASAPLAAVAPPPG